MSCFNKFLRYLIISILTVAIATYILSGMGPLIYLAFIEITELPINLILVSIGSILLGLVGCIALFGTICENKSIQQDLVPIYWLLYSFLNCIAFFFGLAEISYIIKAYNTEQTAVIVLPITAIITVLTVIVTLLSFTIHLLYRYPKVFEMKPKEKSSPPAYEEVKSAPPPSYEEVLVVHN
ncbi:hypothetical protein LOD99_15392 [Oopsacas minuta]|uniref:Uncharacterized protein n=1 Tax=Oopsacas minuta TaxID=111878 RepID=A0AAV7KBG7_9METZ|nr:hypothetical protein LOD99_15392 [Oopsacas minuta]